MAAAKPRRAVLRKAADAGVHPAEPRVAQVRQPSPVRRPESAGGAARAARSAAVGRPGTE